MADPFDLQAGSAPVHVTSREASCTRWGASCRHSGTQRSSSAGLSCLQGCCPCTLPLPQHMSPLHLRPAAAPGVECPAPSTTLQSATSQAPPLSMPVDCACSPLSCCLPHALCQHHVPLTSSCAWSHHNCPICSLQSSTYKMLPQQICLPRCTALRFPIPSASEAIPPLWASLSPRQQLHSCIRCWPQANPAKPLLCCATTPLRPRHRLHCSSPPAVPAVQVCKCYLSATASAAHHCTVSDDMHPVQSLTCAGLPCSCPNTKCTAPCSPSLAKPQPHSDPCLCLLSRSPTHLHASIPACSELSHLFLQLGALFCQPRLYSLGHGLRLHGLLHACLHSFRHLQSQLLLFLSASSLGCCIRLPANAEALSCCLCPPPNAEAQDHCLGSISFARGFIWLLWSRWDALCTGWALQSAGDAPNVLHAQAAVTACLPALLLISGFVH